MNPHESDPIQSHPGQGKMNRTYASLGRRNQSEWPLVEGHPKLHTHNQANTSDVDRRLRDEENQTEEEGDAANQIHTYPFFHRQGLCCASSLLRRMNKVLATNLWISRRKASKQLRFPTCTTRQKKTSISLASGKFIEHYPRN